LACHKYNILHRDLKLDNILLDDNRTMPKICDFGASKLIKRNEKNFGRYGTPVYLAPEVVTDRGYSGFSSDVWSLGVILFALLVGHVPF
jgi:serine/threonine protein kinase